MITYRGVRYIEAGSPLPQNVLRTVDPAIRGILVHINLLPFVEQTVFSCAGYGKAITLSKKGKVSKRRDHSPGTRAYVTIKYKKRGWESFHRDVGGVVEDVEDAHVMFPKWHAPRTYVYVVVEMHNPTYDGMESPPPSYYATAWNKVRAVVSKYEKLHGVYHHEDKVKETPEGEEG